MIRRSRGRRLGQDSPGTSAPPATPARTPTDRGSAAKIVGRAVAIGITGLAVYVVLPSLTRIIAAWPQLSHLSPVWLIGSFLAESASFACAFALQRLVLRTKKWFAVVAAGLAGNAVTNVLPGGDAAGAAVQFRMLATAGIDADNAGWGHDRRFAAGHRRAAGPAAVHAAGDPGRSPGEPGPGAHGPARAGRVRPVCGRRRRGHDDRPTAGAVGPDRAAAVEQPPRPPHQDHRLGSPAPARNATTSAPPWAAIGCGRWS